MHKTHTDIIEAALHTGKVEVYLEMLCILLVYNIDPHAGQRLLDKYEIIDHVVYVK